MASKVQGQLAPIPSGGAWARHLRPGNKRCFWKAERKAHKVVLRTIALDHSWHN